MSNQVASQIADIAVNYNIIEFVNGQKDCKEGNPHKAGMSESYDRGYAVQYELEQIMEAQSVR
jgi:hypothetical protein